MDEMSINKASVIELLEKNLKLKEEWHCETVTTKLSFFDKRFDNIQYDISFTVRNKENQSL